MSNEPEKIRISMAEIENVKLPPPSAVVSGSVRRIGEQPTLGTTGRDYGSVNALPSNIDTKGPLWLKSWFYLGAAGLIGAFLAWAVCEPTFNDLSDTSGFGNIFIFPLMAVLMSVGFASIESAISQAWSEFFKKAFLAIFVGGVLAFIATFVASLIYTAGLAVVIGNKTDLTGQELLSTPGIWFARAFAWLVFGAVAGLIYGLFDKSGKKILYGLLGGMLGGFIGGLLFDPINLLFSPSSAALSRVVGMCILGIVTGVAIGFVENALKEKWLYITAGPLAGKQFVLYKNNTILGSGQGSDIYLFKDPSIQPAHAMIHNVGNRAQIDAAGITLVNNRPVTTHSLTSGDTIQVGKYTFLYYEKKKT
jgi:hypothetical protein